MNELWALFPRIIGAAAMGWRNNSIEDLRQLTGTRFGMHPQFWPGNRADAPVGPDGQAGLRVSL